MKPPAGLTLVELLTAMLLVLLVSAASLAFVARGRAAERAGVAQSELEETLDAAFRILGAEISMAGYLGLAAPGTLVEGATPVGTAEFAGLAVAGSCGPSLALDLAIPLTAADGSYRVSPGIALGCRPSPAGRTRPGADTLILRRASDSQAVPQAGRLQLETRLRHARLVADGAGGPGAGARWHDLEAGVYYVSADSTGHPGRPSLRRKRLVGGTRPAFQDEELVTGIADLQIALGLDAGGDGDRAVDRWSEPGTQGADEVLRAVRIALVAENALRDPGLPQALRRRQASRVFALRNAVAIP